MKKVFRVFGFIAVAALAISCADNNIEAPVTDLSHSILIHAGLPDTRTEIVEGVSSASFKWSSDDADRFVIKENSIQGTDIMLTLGSGNATMTLGATFATESAAEYTYTASLAKNRTGAGWPKIPAAQASSESSYDPDADILVAKSLTFGSIQDEVKMQFARPCVINKMTLKGLDNGESISSIVVSADKYITGYYEEGTWKGQSRTITISTSQTVPASGEVTVYFVTMPVDAASLTVTVTTGSYIYSKSFTSTINFVLNQVTRFGVSSLTRISKADYSGTYVLTNATGTKMACAWAGGNNLPELDVTLDGGTIYYDPDAVTIANSQIVVTKITDPTSDYYGMYTLTQNGKYLYAAGSDKNYLKGENEADINAYWEISETAGNWSIIASRSSNRNVMQYNGNNKFFSCYSSASQTAVALKSSFAPTPVITADASIVITSDAVSSATSTGATFNSNTASVTAAAYSDAECTSASTWLSVSTSGSGSSTVVNYTASANTGGERTAYIKITATNSSSHSVSRIITLTQSASGVSGGTVTFTFGTNITATSGTIGTVSLASSNSNHFNASTGTAPAYNESNKELRIYRYGSITLSCTTNITSVSITYSSSSYTGSDTGSNTGTYTCTDDTGSWSGSSKSIQISNKGTTNVQMRIKSISVTYE